MLTEEQERIANHTIGPALVFAVAGSGKTHTLVERIRRLVENNIFTPRQILATTFNTSARDEINQRLHTLKNCSQVHALTLHGLGFNIIKTAAGTTPGLIQNEDELLRPVLWGLERKYKSIRYEWAVGIQETDILDLKSWISSCKGNLCYADLDAANLPPNKVATQAKAPEATPWYLEIYKEFEKLLRQSKQISFDDMLLQGWESLLRHPQIKLDYQHRYHCVIVDEFQDLNLAQAEMLHLIASEHSNYMAIGDDDQTIYEWRGANPEFIVSFETRYNATKYLISDNFRCQAAPIALANSVIRHNRNREPKSLSLTKEFRKGMDIVTGANNNEMAKAIVDRLQWQHDHGNVSWKDMAILIRVHAQTAPFEVECRKRNIPFSIFGQKPFFITEPVRIIQAYAELALAEMEMQKSPIFGNQNLLDIESALKTCINKPSRFANEAQRQFLSQSISKGNSPSQSLLLLASRSERGGQGFITFAGTLQYLAGYLTDEAHMGSSIIDVIANSSGYLKHIQSTSVETSISESETALEILGTSLAGCKGIKEVLAFIETEQTQAKQQADTLQEDKIQMLTIFKAKGLEWPVVAIPNVNQGYYPHPLSERIEEERRIFYVATTRSKEYLYLGIDSSKKNSWFLEQADIGRIDKAITDLERLFLHRSPESWSAQETYQFAGIVENYGFFRYLSAWAIPGGHFGEDRIIHAVERVLSLYQALNKPIPTEWKELDPLTDQFIEFPDMPALLEALTNKAQPPSAATTSIVTKPVAITLNDKGFPPHTRVSHPKMGAGIILSNSAHGADRKILVRFDNGQERILVLGIALGTGLVKE